MTSTTLSPDMHRAFAQNPTLLARISELKNANLFMTGGTGFFGCWLLESLIWLKKEYSLDFQLTLLTRNPNAFRQKRPQFSDLSFLKLHTGDIRSFDFPEGRFTHLIHCATDSDVKNQTEHPLLTFDTIVGGTRRALDFALHSGVSKFLLTSSGAVYGRQDPGMTHISEDCFTGPNPLSPQSAYAEGKRAAEYLCSVYSGQGDLEVKVARCFAFLGPYLPLNTHFAAGNFIADAMAGRPIQIQGDATPWRSYLYGADLATWLWAILLCGAPCRAYNVGSEVAVSIGELAQTVTQVIAPGVPVQIKKKGNPAHPAERYVPSTKRCQTELGLKQSVDLKEAIRKTAEWYSKGT